MPRQRLPQSIRKFIRKEKSRLRREFSDSRELVQAIDQLYKRFRKVED